LPQNKFTGDYTKSVNKNGINYYEIIRGRRLLAIIPDPQQPIQVYLCRDIFLSLANINGINKYKM
jgi:hypothetical protein